MTGWRAWLADFLHSIRLRLTLWFVVVLALVLLVFNGIVYSLEVQATYTHASNRLDLRLRELGDGLRRSLHNAEEEDGVDLPRFLAADQGQADDQEVLILVESSGALSGGRGPISNQQAAQVASVAAAQNGTRSTSFSGRAFEYGLNVQQGNRSVQVPYLFATLPIGYENRIFGWLIAGQPIDPEGQLPRLRWVLILASLVTLVFALVGGYWLADRTLWPVKAITRTAQEIGESDLSQRLNIRTRDELGQLASTFDHMLDRLQAAFTRQRQFTADASHELRTPLTIIGLETDRALAARRSVEDYQHSLQVIRSENEFMTRLVGELLTLARMDSGQVKLKRELLDLSDVALEVSERYSPIAERKGIALKTSDLPEVMIEGDRQYLVQMIGNLVDNAIKYSPAGTGQWVKVETGSRPPDSTKSAGPALAWVRVSDNGPGIAADHLPRLFDRFYRVDQARSHNPQGTSALDENQPEEEIPGSGLGLSIVQWIAEMHHGQVRVKSSPNQGTTFEIDLPSVDPSKRTAE